MGSSEEAFAFLDNRDQTHPVLPIFPFLFIPPGSSPGSWHLETSGKDQEITEIQYLMSATGQLFL